MDVIVNGCYFSISRANLQSRGKKVHHLHKLKWMFARSQGNWTPISQRCWENRAAKSPNSTRSVFLFAGLVWALASQHSATRSAGNKLKMSIIPVAANPICMQRGHAPLLSFGLNLALRSKVVQSNLHKASLQMPNSPSARTASRANPKVKTSTWNWSFCRSVWSGRLPQSILASQRDRWGWLGRSRAGYLLLASPRCEDTSRHPLSRKRLW